MLRIECSVTAMNITEWNLLSCEINRLWAVHLVIGPSNSVVINVIWCVVAEAVLVFLRSELVRRIQYRNLHGRFIQHTINVASFMSFTCINNSQTVVEFYLLILWYDRKRAMCQSYWSNEEIEESIRVEAPKRVNLELKPMILGLEFRFIVRTTIKQWFTTRC